MTSYGFLERNKPRIRFKELEMEFNDSLFFKFPDSNIIRVKQRDITESEYVSLAGFSLSYTSEKRYSDNRIVIILYTNPKSLAKSLQESILKNLETVQVKKKELTQFLQDYNDNYRIDNLTTVTFKPKLQNVFQNVFLMINQYDYGNEKLQTVSELMIDKYRFFKSPYVLFESFSEEEYRGYYGYVINPNIENMGFKLDVID